MHWWLAGFPPARVAISPESHERTFPVPEVRNCPARGCPTGALPAMPPGRRNKLAFAAVSAVAAALLLGLGLSMWQWRKAVAAKARMAQNIDLFVNGQVTRSV